MGMRPGTEEKMHIAADFSGGDACNLPTDSSGEGAATGKKHKVPDSVFPMMESPEGRKQRKEEQMKQTEGKQTRTKDFGETNKRLALLFFLAGLVLLCVLIYMTVHMLSEGNEAQDSAATLLEAYKNMTPSPTPEQPVETATPEPSPFAEPSAVPEENTGETETAEGEEPSEGTENMEEGGADPEEIVEGDAVSEEDLIEAVSAEEDEENAAVMETANEFLLPGDDEDVDESGEYVQPEAPEVDEAAEILEKVINKVGEGAVLGIIEIPEIDIELPVISKWSYPLLKVSVCRYKGPDMNKKGNLVIIGHNYKSGAHFGNLSKLKVGSAIYLTDSSGNKVRYEVYKRLVIEPDDFKAVETYKGTCGLTLLTCQNSGTQRLLLRCVQKDAEIPQPR